MRFVLLAANRALAGRSVIARLVDLRGPQDEREETPCATPPLPTHPPDRPEGLSIRGESIRGEPPSLHHLADRSEGLSLRGESVRGESICGAVSVGGVPRDSGDDTATTRPRGG